MIDDLRAIAQASPAGFAHIVSAGKWVPAEHLLKVDEYLLALANDEINRLIIEVPVRHGKSVLCSEYFPAWWLGMKPDDQVMFAAYQANFAEEWGRKSRDTLLAHGEEVFGIQPSTTPAASRYWTILNHKGQMVATGIGGALTGRGADLMVIDDPIKDAEQALSSVYREKTWNWWQGTARSRLEPNAKALLVMARWHEDDLSGRLQTQEVDEPWTVLRLPAISEGPDALRKDANEALWPERYPLAQLERIKQDVGTYWFNAQYQMRPSSPAGNKFKREDFCYWKYADESDAIIFLFGDAPKTINVSDLIKFQSVDVAASAKTTADYTVVGTYGLTKEGDLLLLDIQRSHYELGDVPKFIERCNDAKDRPPIYIETFGHGHGPYKTLIEDGYPAIKLKPEHGTTADKIQRSFRAVALYEAHKAYHPKGAKFLADFEEEIIGFPYGPHDDQVDTLSYAAQIAPSLISFGKTNSKHLQITPTVMAGVLTERF